MHLMALPYLISDYTLAILNLKWSHSQYSWSIGNSVLLSRHDQSKDLASSRDLIAVQEDDNSNHHQLCEDFNESKILL